MKRCTKCGAEKPLEEFPRRIESKDGRRSPCRACKYAARKTEHGKKLIRGHYANSVRRHGQRVRPERLVQIQRTQQRREQRRLALLGASLQKLYLAAQFDFAMENYESPREQYRRIAWTLFGDLSKVRGRETGPWSIPGLDSAERYRLRYRYDESFATKERMRRQLKKQAKKLGVAELMRGAINRNGNSPTVELVVGYSITELVAHLEKQFTKGMDWSRYRCGDIHIDHIVPVKDFSLERNEEVRACWALSNLRPVWADENLRKSARRTHLL